MKDTTLWLCINLSVCHEICHMDELFDCGYSLTSSYFHLNPGEIS